MEPTEDHLLAFEQLLMEIENTLLEVRRYTAVGTPECLEMAKLKVLQLRSLAGVAFGELKHCFYDEDNDTKEEDNVPEA